MLRHALLLTGLALLALGCASVPPRSGAAQQVEVLRVFPKDQAVEPLGEVRVSHGNGCGLLGALGSYDGAAALIANRAARLGGDLVVVTGESKPHHSGSCRVNSYVLKGKVFRRISYSYTAPERSSEGGREFRAVVASNREAAWDSLVDVVSSSFFRIENYERSSGLLTLSFDDERVDEFVDCGRWKAAYRNGDVSFDDSYVKWMKKHKGAFDVAGRINLRLKELSPTRTQAEVNVLYRLDFQGNTWRFTSRTRRTLEPEGRAAGTATTRTCEPTLALEKLLLERVEAMAFAG